MRMSLYTSLTDLILAFLFRTEFYGNTAGDHRTVSPEHPPEGARRSTSVEGDSPLNDDNAGASDDSDIVELNDDLQRFLILDDREIPRQTEEIY